MIRTALRPKRAKRRRWAPFRPDHGKRYVSADGKVHRASRFETAPRAAIFVDPVRAYSSF